MYSLKKRKEVFVSGHGCSFSPREDMSSAEPISKNKTDFSQQFIDEPFLEALDEWVWEMDMQGIHTYSNHAVEKILGYKVEEVVGFSTQKLWTKTSRKMEKEIFKQSLAAGTGWKNFPAHFVHKDGSIKILLSSAIPVFDAEGKLKGYRGIDRDITERVMNENRLKAQKEHTRLINRILRHDLTNNFTVINSALRLYDSTNDRNYLSEIKGSLDRSIKLIRSMGEQEAFLPDNSNLKVYSIQDVLDEVINEKTEAKIKINGDSHILADEVIYSVFENIINNAFTHGKASRITINIRNKDMKCQISIEDNGQGIPDEIKDKIFEEGFKYGTSGNTGIGLFIVKKAMENYRGEVSVEDNIPTGTIIKLTFNNIVGS